MSPLDEAPEQRWRRVVDRRNRPAKLKVDRLVRDFGYAELDDEVGDAIEARLAGVALAVAPSLRNAIAGEVVTIYANDSAASERGRRPVAEPPAVHPRRRDVRPVGVVPAKPEPVPAAAPAQAPAAAADVAQMVSYLKQQVLDARAESERLRTELGDRVAAARTDVERDTEAIIVQQAAVLQEQDRQIAELGAALDATRQALADTRDEIRRAVGELQIAPESIALEDEPPPLHAAGAAPPDLQDTSAGDVEPPVAEAGLGVDEPADGPDETAAAPPAAELPAAPLAPDGGNEIATLPPVPVPVPAPVPVPVPGPADDAASDLDEPTLDVVEPVRDIEEPVFDVDEPPLGVEDEPAAVVPPLGVEEEAAAAVPPLGVEEEPAAAVPSLGLEEEEPAAAVPPPDAGDEGEPQPDPAPPPDRSESNVTWLRERDAPAAPDAPPPAEPARSENLDAPLPQSSEWLPADFRPQPDARPAAADALPPTDEPESESDRDARLTDFDDFLYDADELYNPDDPDPAAVIGEPLEAEIEARWPDEPAALPPPPPVPPSPFAGDEDPQRPAAAAGRPKRGGVLRGRSGRVRSRWDGSCSVCGRLPLENRRKDLEAAGWDLNDDAAACPQCRGVG